MVTSVDLPAPADADNVGDAFTMHFGLRMFNPIAWATFSCPLRQQLWAFDSTALDFRAAQNESAMIPREGPWYSSCEDNLKGTVKLTSPLHGSTLSLPEEIHVTVRVSWAPAHLVIRFEEAGVLQKISPRPLNTQPSGWREGIYQADVFTPEIKLDHPAMFFIPSEIPPEAAAKMTNPPIAEPVYSESEDEWAAEEWNAWYAWGEHDWNDWHRSDDDRQTNNPLGSDAMPDLPPMPDVPVPEPAVEPAVSPSISSPVTASVSVTPVSKFFDAETVAAAFPPAPISGSPVVTTEAPPGDIVSVAPSGTAHSISDAMSMNQFQEDFRKLQALAAQGRPRTLDERYARQVYANRLGLAPAVYNMLVFGEAPP